MSSPAFDPEDYALSEEGSNAPSWLYRFVRAEVRPLLIERRPAALAALARWLACHEERKRELQAREAKRTEFLRQLAALPEEQRDTPEPPAEGYAWREPLVTLDDGRTIRVKGWLPLELWPGSVQAIEYPLPLPIDRDLSADECWSVLIAMHDVCRVRREQLGPADSIPFLELRTLATGLRESHLPDLQAILAQARASLAATRQRAGREDGGGKARRGGGKRRLEQSNPLKFQIYDRIRQAHEPNADYGNTVDRLKADRQLVEQVSEAGLKLNTRLVRNALAFFDQRERDEARKKQQADPT
jgi:hypothetical protein